MEHYCVGKLKGFEKKKAKLAPVSPVLQAPEPSSSSNKGSSSLSTVTSLSVLSTGLAAVYYTSQRQGISLTKTFAHLRLPTWLTSHLRTLLPKSPSTTTQSSSLSLLQGVLLGAGISAIAATLLVKKFSSMIWSSKSFTSYPPHKKVPKRAASGSNNLLERGFLDPVKYTPLPLKTKTLVAPNVYRFVFSLPTPTTVLGLPIGQHVTIKADVDGESVQRSYTPVSNNSDLGVLVLVTKIYQNGKLSGYLEKLQVGDEVLFRGPKGAMKYQANMVRKIGMVAGGTGITPMYQVIRAICESETDTTEVSLIYANRTEEDILLRKELDGFARRYPKQFKVWYMLDTPPVEGWMGGKGFVTQDVMRERLPAKGKEGEVKMMLCGPPGMVNASKKALGGLGFEVPGASAKAGDEIFCF